MLRRAFCAVLFLAGCVLSVNADDKLTLKADKIAPPKELAEPIRALLDEQAIQMLDEKSAAFATLWLRKSLPSNAAPEQIKGGLTYREIPETTVIGAIQFPQPWIDYRKQKIPAGIYTMRLAFQPQNGDHMGTAPFSDFCLLSPAGKDQTPDTMMAKELHELSANAPGGSHPGVMLLYPNAKPEDEPKLASKPNETWVLNFKRSVNANGTKTALGFGLTVAGHTTQD